MPKMKSKDNLKQKFFWKGKRVSEKVYNKRRMQQCLGKNLRCIYGSKSVHNPQSNDLSRDNDSGIEGRRIIHLQTLGSQLICKKCNSVLSLLDAASEQQYGLASVFDVQCRRCKLFTKVSTDKKHSINNSNTEIAPNIDRVCNQSQHYDTNSKAVIGTLNAGLGSSHLNKLLSSLNIPEMNVKTYYRHEKEVGEVAERMAHESCLQAAQEEKMMTIENKNEIVKLL